MDQMTPTSHLSSKTLRHQTTLPLSRLLSVKTNAGEITNILRKKDDNRVKDVNMEIDLHGISNNDDVNDDVNQSGNSSNDD